MYYHQIKIFKFHVFVIWVRSTHSMNLFLMCYVSSSGSIINYFSEREQEREQLCKTCII